MSKVIHYQAYYRAKRKAQGRCQRCGKRKEPSRQAVNYCELCQIKHTLRRGMEAYAEVETNAGTTTCLYCDQPFRSPDVRRVRTHPLCRLKALQVADHYDYWME